MIMTHIDTKNAVKIAVRERPNCKIGEFDSINSGIVNSGNANVLIIGDRSFPFDYVLGPEVTQEKLYLEIAKPLVLKFIEGFHCTALAYGQTGTGKSYSMGLNNVKFLQESAGIIPRCLDEIFNLIDSLEVNVYVSFIEIYNEKVFDILSNDCEAPINTKGFKFCGGLKKQILNAEDGYNYLGQGMKNRHVRPTKMNQLSSRSHAIFTIHKSKIMETQTVESCLNLVDLAGSEGVRRTGHEGVALAEGVNINQGLLSIGKVLQALSAGNKVIPYRDSILSSVLQDSLKRNSFLTLLACISPLICDNSETLSTIRFAQNTKSLRNKPQINTYALKVQKSDPLRSTNLKKHENTILRTKLFNCDRIDDSARKRKFSNISFLTPIATKPKRIHALHHTNSQHKVCSIKKLRDTSNVPEEKCNHSNSFTTCDNDKPDLRSSLNFHTLTTLADPTTLSVSPIIKKCLSAFEVTLDEKIQKALNTLKGYNSNCTTNDCVNNAEIIAHTNRNSIAWNDIKLELQDMVHNEIISLKQQSEKAIREVVMENGQPVDNLLDNLISRDTVFKVPQLPCNEHLLNASRQSHIFNTDGGKLCQSVNNPVRRSLRLSSIGQNNNLKDSDEVKPRISPYQPLRRSLRLSSIEKNNNIKDLSEIKLNTSEYQYPRRSLRLSSVLNNNPYENDNKYKENCCTDYRTKAAVSYKTRKISKEMEKKFVIEITKNDFINEYFAKDTKNLKATKIEHEKAVFNLLNNGSINELKVLPQIGLKTAYQIITYRTLNGKFKSFNSISKLPVWKGTSWERFKKANNIDQ